MSKDQTILYPVPDGVSCFFKRFTKGTLARPGARDWRKKRGSISSGTGRDPACRRGGKKKVKAVLFRSTFEDGEGREKREVG